jgi:hypothetical protein
MVASSAERDRTGLVTGITDRRRKDGYGSFIRGAEREFRDTGPPVVVAAISLRRYAMTQILVGGMPCEARIAGQIAEAERQVRSFLMTATRYLAPGRDLVALSHLEAAADDTRSMTADEFDRTLLKVWRNPGK